MNPLSVYIRITLATLFWGANFALAGPVLQDLPPLWAAAMRFVLGATMMLLLAIWRGAALATPARRHAPAFIGVASVGIVGFNLLFFFAMQTTSPANGALIMATNPLVTTLIAYAFLAERPNPRQYLALPLAFIGVMVVISGGDMQRILSLSFSHGDLLMLGANLAWACYNVMSRRYLPGGSPLINTTLVMSSGAVLLLLVALSSTEHVHVPGMHAMIALLLMASGGTVLAYLFWMTGIAQLGAGRTALFLNLVPVFAMFIAYLLGTAPTHIQIIGGLLVIGSVSLAMLPQRQRAPA
jgi:drug/metabolite transporter (DMT)-like permease